ncbi:MAG: hypothetical protein QNJ54_00915 [Prochloraceae cyanobacterium]|nr:hypothetical protein [Prochloraceae cyanobacterium]
MSDIELQQIQAIQFSDRATANRLLKDFFNANLPFGVKEVTVRPLAVSLNSINGFIFTEEGEKLFFKTHVEPQSIIDEYYNSGILAEAGYPVIQPIFSSTEWGKQLLIYKFFDSPSLFNVIRDLETNKRTDAEKIVDIQQEADEQLWDIYLKTLQSLTAAEHAKVPVHQLFYHRLTGGRFTSFYQNKEIILPGEKIDFDRLAQLKWVINGIEFKHTLDELVELAIQYLNPSSQDTSSVVGHGDAHNGNVFIDEQNKSLVYFDPAFAGRHSPFLDLTKPLFHNVFAIWMYFPQEVASELSIQSKIQENTIVVEHNFVPAKVRIDILRSKLERVLKPLLKELKARNLLDDRWREYLKLALFCCPFLTMNLSDSNKFPPEISLLGFAMSVEMGSTNTGEKRSLLDSELDKVI